MAGELKKLNTFLMLKVPAAWLCGVRIKAIDSSECRVGVRHRWINQNPFNSMYFAVQAMAAELSTGALVMKQVQDSGRKISMLVKSNKASYHKKATGKIIFTSSDGALVQKTVEEAIKSGEGQTIWMNSTGINEDGVEVSSFSFEWTLKLRE